MIGISLAISYWAWGHLEMSLEQLERLSRMSDYLGKFYPPSADLTRSHWWSLFDTLAIAWLSTLFGLVIALPLSLLASRNLFSPWVTTTVRALLSLVRSVPSLIWALIFIVIVGFGPPAGVLALACYTVGYLGKMFYEVFEGIAVDALEAHRAMGMSRLEEIRHVVLPTTANALVSQSIYMLEYNFRHSTVLGVVGAGGIGRVMMQHMELGEYDRFASVLFLVLAVVLLLDALSGRLRRRFQDERFQSASSSGWFRRAWASVRRWRG